MSSGFSIKRILNSPVNSNCYAIQKNETDKCILVDPAQEQGYLLYDYLVAKNIVPEYIILTHEHFDHISSIDHLRKIFKCNVIATKICSERMLNSKKNLSLFHDQVGFSCNPADIFIDEQNLNLTWEGININFYLTPGHSEGSLCFSIGSNLFTGDTVIGGHKTIVKLPGGNRNKLKNSLIMLFDLFGSDTIIFPGHGPSFPLSQIDIYSVITDP